MLKNSGFKEEMIWFSVCLFFIIKSRPNTRQCYFHFSAILQVIIIYQIELPVAYYLQWEGAFGFFHRLTNTPNTRFFSDREVSFHWWIRIDDRPSRYLAILKQNDGKAQIYKPWAGISVSQRVVTCLSRIFRTKISYFCWKGRHLFSIARTDGLKYYFLSNLSCDVFTRTNTLKGERFFAKVPYFCYT